MDFSISDVVDVDKVAQEVENKEVKKGSMQGNIGPLLESHLTELQSIKKEEDLDNFIELIINESEDEVAREKFRFACMKRKKFLDRYSYVYKMYMNYAGLLKDIK